jgi:predicted nucleotidyltransferase
VAKIKNLSPSFTARTPYGDNSGSGKSYTIIDVKNHFVKFFVNGCHDSYAEKILNSVTKKGTIVPRMDTSGNSTNLSATLFGKTRRAVLSLLYSHADEAFYLRQIARNTGVGLGAVQRELKNLTDTGIITREVQGRQVYYRANAQCPIFNELKGIVRKTFGVADVIRQSLATVADKIQVAFIFGSIARSADDRKSDIDVMVVGDISFGDMVFLLSTAEEKLGREINVVVYPISEFKQKVREDHYFVKTVLEGEKIFLIGDEGELAKLVSKETPLVSERFRLPHNRLTEFCSKHHIRRLSLFGSILTEDFHPDSDIDVLVEFQPGHVPGFGIIDMENELSQLVGRKVDLRTPGDLSRYFRDRVVREARVEYAETQS